MTVDCGQYPLNTVHEIEKFAPGPGQASMGDLTMVQPWFFEGPYLRYNCNIFVSGYFNLKWKKRHLR